MDAEQKRQAAAAKLREAVDDLCDLSIDESEIEDMVRQALDDNWDDV